ncbi:MAG TPA: flagellar hook-associated protein FlgK [Bryobacteraceae bacterium]|nr:flagellar hook-associated protein FlgK [Bryobacteraceae bacterium]
MSDLFSMLRSSANTLQAYQTALDISSDNVNNAQTPGWVRQAAPLQALSFDPQNGAEGGVQEIGPQSTRNEFAEAAVRQQSSAYGNSSQLSTSLDPIVSAFDVTGQTGVQPALNALFQSFSAWSTTPGDPSAQTGVISAAGQLATAFQQTASQIASVRTTVDGDLQTTVNTINQLTASIQKYNTTLSGQSTPDPAVDAQLNSSLEQLSQLANIQVLHQPDGTITVLANGQIPLVVGNHQYSLSVAPPSNPAGSANPTATPNAVILDGDGNDVTSLITGGSLGALINVRNTVIPGLIGGPNVTGQLNQLAAQVSTAVNGILAQGGGAPLFSVDPTSAVNAASSISVAAGFQPSDLVAADPGPPPVSNGLALKLANLANDTTNGVQGQTLSGFFSSIAASVGSTLNQAKSNATVNQQTLTQAQNLRQQLSGVSLDTEALNVLQLQRSYQAASKVITVVDELTQTLIDMVQ